MRLTSPAQRIPALLGAAAVLAASLAGCTALPGTGGCDPLFPSGRASDAVSAEGRVGARPDVDFPTPLVAPAPEVTRVVAGEGQQVGRDGQVDFALTYFDAATGEEIGSLGYGAPGGDDGPARSAVGIEDYAISGALACASVGDRLVLTATGADAGMQDAARTYVFVIDVLAAYLGKADGMNLLPQDGMPTVVTEVDGTPAVALGLVEQPETTRAETVKSGSGAAVRAGDRVVAHLRAWTWPAGGGTPTEFASTWNGAYEAYTMSLEDRDDNPVPPGVRRAVDGATVGSQLLVVIPPGEDGYTQPPQGVAEDATMIWVVDILGIQKSGS